MAFLGLLGACGSGEDLTLPSLGDLTVTVTTTGEPDSDGYTLVLDGGSPHALVTTDSIVVPDLLPGDHRLDLSGLAAGCEVQNPNPLVITVVAGAESRAAFTVSCPPPAGTGGIAVRISTSGPGTDPDGYTLLADLRPERPVATTDSVTLEDLTVGTHTVRLGGVASACEVRSQNPQQVTVVEHDLVPLQFEVACWPPPSGTVVFLRRDFGEFSLSASDLFVESAAGTGIRNLTGTPDVEEGSPVWSPDGRTVAFDAETVDADGTPDGGHGIFLADASGGAPSQVATGFGTIAWSPAGGKLLFEHDRSGLAVLDVRTRKVDTLVASDAPVIPNDAAWAPDGRHIAIAWLDINGVGTPSIRLIDPDGRHLTTVVRPDAIPGADDFQDVVWSPDGRRLATILRRTFVEDVFVLDPSGVAAPVNVTNDPADYRDLRWSPDGRSLTFAKLALGAPSGQLDLYNLRLSDGLLTRLAPSPGDYSTPAWSPDGNHLVYVKTDSKSVLLSELWIVNADGSGSRRLTAGGHLDTAPQWAP
jgi:Tol biopolymer transport system component